MKTRLLLALLLSPIWVAPAFAQKPKVSAAAPMEIGRKTVLLNQALSAFRRAAYPEGLNILGHVVTQDPGDEEVRRLYRLNANRFAIQEAEDCEDDLGLAHCDSALKYVELARHLGDSSVYHEVRAMALYQKVISTEATEIAAYKPQTHERITSPAVAYRYLPEHRKLFLRELIQETLEEVRVARGDLERRDKITDLSQKMRAIEKTVRMVGTR